MAASKFKDAKQRESHIVDFVVETARSSEEQTLPDRKRWKESEELFAGIMDWGADNENEEWQSRVFLHEFSTIIREASTSVQNLIFSRQDFINLESTDEVNEEFAKIIEKLMKYYVDKIRFPQRFYEYCLAGGVYGFATWKYTVGINLAWRPEVVIEKIEAKERAQASKISGLQKQKVYTPDSMEAIEANLWESVDKLFGEQQRYGPRKVEGKKRPELNFQLDLINPLGFMWYPDAAEIAQSPYFIERIHKSFVELSPLLDAGVLDKSKKDALLRQKGFVPSYGLTSSYESRKRRQRDQNTDVSKYFPVVELLEYYGPLLSDKGEVLEENKHFIVANGKVLVKDDIIRYWDQRPPYITSVFSKRPFKAVGAGIADNAVPQQKLINELFSLFVDMLRLDVYAPRAVNTDMIVDKSQIEAGIAPGALIHTFNGDARQAFSELPKHTQSAPELFQTIEMLKLSGQKASSINTMSSNPASRARISANEISSNDARRLESVNTLGMEVDANCIEPLVDRTKDLILQFALEDMNIKFLLDKNIITQSEFQILTQMTSIDRFVESQKDYKLEVRGFKAAIDRQEQLKRVSEFLSQLNQMPPQVHDSLDWKALLKDVTEAYGFNSNKWIIQNTPRDKAYEENNLLKLDQPLALWNQDDDMAHIPVHYEGLAKYGPVQSLIIHTKAHIQRAIQMGQIPPDPPTPEIAQMLGIMPEAPAIKEQKMGLKRLESKTGRQFPSPSNTMQ